MINNKKHQNKSIKTKPMLMIGPDIKGLGGISRVARIYSDTGVFKECKIKYIPSVTDEDINKLFFLLKNILFFIKFLITGTRAVYIHASSGKSFYRKSLFLCLALLFRKKVIFHIHPSHFYDFLMNLSGFKKKFSFSLLLKAATFIVLTESMKEKISSLFPEKATYVLRNPINLKLFNNSHNNRRRQHQLLFLGWFIPEKGVYDLVDATEILIKKGFGLQLYFFGTKQRKELINYVETKKLAHVIQVGKWLSDDEKIDYLYKSTMLILPSYSEGIPNVILEAMATKTPIVATQVGGLSEVLKNNYNAVITLPGNPERLSSDIERTLKDDQFRERIALNAHKDAREKYDISIVKERFKKIIDSTTGQ
ncbi:MAG: glycosyltransferase family 4 protein [Candidatus Krumholzibacteriota bacterium]|nr:glycosyltransferase family 4 protein [Candidatus Krumholzibacteriota bacterium]